MHDPIFFPFDCVVYIIHVYFHLTKSIVDIFTSSFVMIARDINYFGAISGFAKNFLNYIIVFLRPKETLLKLPSINNVTDKIESIALRMF